VSLMQHYDKEISEMQAKICRLIEEKAVGHVGSGRYSVRPLRHSSQRNAPSSTIILADRLTIYLNQSEPSKPVSTTTCRRYYQESKHFKERYKIRSGIEATISGTSDYRSKARLDPRQSPCGRLHFRMTHSTAIFGNVVSVLGS
jgi:hypothetical protein